MAMLELEVEKEMFQTKDGMYCGLEKTDTD
jgi:hypothetical protein